MALPEHSKIINKIAREILKEYGIKRKGQSRTWLDDQYWFTTIVEFQPHSGRQGTCLNVGVNFHWYEKKHFSFDIGYRESKFIDFVNEKQFEPEINSLVNLALKKTLELRQKLTNSKTAINTILNYEYTSDSLWGNYHRAIICGLNNEPKKSEHYFNLVLENKLECDWEQELKRRVDKLKKELNNTSDFRNKIDKIIAKTRTEKKLKETEVKNVW